MDPHVQYSLKQCPSTLAQIEQIKGVLYSKVIRLILWPTVVSRPDTAYAVGILSQFMQNPGQNHWDTVKHIIRYLGCMKGLWLTFGGKTNMTLPGYFDVD
jgi:hypothetical protein